VSENPTIDPAVVIGHMVDLLVRQRDEARAVVLELAVAEHSRLSQEIEQALSIDHGTITALGEVVEQLGLRKDVYNFASIARDLLASEPMSRIRAAWIAEAVRGAVSGDQELVRLRAEVERLRAAQPVDLPDVGPVTRRWPDGFTDGLTDVVPNLVDSYGAAGVKEAIDAYLHAETQAAESLVPDTSRVSFGARHEDTGMVLLHHADLTHETWGWRPQQDASWHRKAASVSVRDRAVAHAALAEVREALNTAEQAGVDVEDNGYIWASGSLAHRDDPTHEPEIRARRYLAREVQALVDQGLRGDALNAAVPYEVRDHRAPEPETDQQLTALAQVIGDEPTARNVMAFFGRTKVAEFLTARAARGGQEENQ